MKSLTLLLVTTISFSLHAQPGNCDWVTGRNDTLFYGADSCVQIAIFTDIYNPEYIDQIQLSGEAIDIRFHQSNLYAFYSSDGSDLWYDEPPGIDSIEVFNVSDLSNPILSHVYRFPHRVTDIQLVGDHLFYVDSTGLRILRENEEHQLIEVGHYESPVVTSHLSVDGQVACIASSSWEDGCPIFLVDISDPANPKTLGQPFAVRDTAGQELLDIHFKDEYIWINGPGDNGYIHITILENILSDSISILNSWSLGQLAEGSISLMESTVFIGDVGGYRIFNLDSLALIEWPWAADAEWTGAYFDPPIDFWPFPPIEFIHNYGFIAGGHGLFVIETIDPMSPIWLGEFGRSTLDITTRIAPDDAILFVNYPNPFNPSTTISYKLAQESDVSLTIYDVTGRKITTLVNTAQIAGTHQVQWNGLDASGNQVSTGVYLCCFETGGYYKTIKLILLK